MRVTYDPDTDAAYIYLSEIGAGEAQSIPVDLSGHPKLAGATIVLDVNDEGVLLGLEVLDASLHLPPEIVTSAERLRGTDQRSEPLG